jgi:type III pantothenate kinase
MNEPKRCLQLDTGNSSTKWRLVEGEELIGRGKYRPDDKASLQQLLECTSWLHRICIASVASVAAEFELTEILRDRWAVQPWFARTQAETLGLVNSYEKPSKMGVDRWLAMLGGIHYLSGRICVVDAGSALTIDVVAANGQHEGGYIIPGAALMEQALSRDTDRIRFNEDADYSLTPGKSTAEAVRHGVALAQAGSLRLALDRLNIDEQQVIVCGGGGDLLRQLLDGVGHYKPDLVFEGLALAAN